MASSPRPRTSERLGFTLAEVTISTAIVGLAVVIAMGVFASGARAQGLTYMRMVAAISADYLLSSGAKYGVSYGVGSPATGPTSSVQSNLSAGILTTYDNVTNKVDLENYHGETVYAFTGGDSGNPQRKLLIGFAPATSPVQPMSGGTLSVCRMTFWTCDFRNKPANASVRAAHLKTFIYYDPQGP